VPTSINGMVVPTELVDLIDGRGGRIFSHIEIFRAHLALRRRPTLSSRHARPLCAVLE
jgi:hypothetical protein